MRSVYSDRWLRSVLVADSRYFPLQMMHQMPYSAALPQKLSFVPVFLCDLMMPSSALRPGMAARLLEAAKWEDRTGPLRWRAELCIVPIAEWEVTRWSEPWVWWSREAA